MLDASENLLLSHCWNFNTGTWVAQNTLPSANSQKQWHLIGRNLGWGTLGTSISRLSLRVSKFFCTILIFQRLRWFHLVSGEPWHNPSTARMPDDVISWTGDIPCFVLHWYLNGIEPIEALERVRNGLWIVGNCKERCLLAPIRSSSGPTEQLFYIHATSMEVPSSPLVTFNFAYSIAEFCPSLNVEAKLFSNDIHFSHIVMNICKNSSKTSWNT
jgi:hypothetical protein